MDPCEYCHEAEQPALFQIDMEARTCVFFYYYQCANIDMEPECPCSYPARYCERKKELEEFTVFLQQVALAVFGTPDVEIEFYPEFDGDPYNGKE